MLKILMDYFMNNFSEFTSSPLFKILSENSFDINKVLSNLDISKILPVLSDFLSQNKNPTENNSSMGNISPDLSPIINIADKEIIYCLNNYLV